jgi:hypothetical protein
VTNAAQVCRVLASQARCGMTVRRSLVDLPSLVPSSCRGEAEAAAHLASLGAPSGLVVERLFRALGEPAAGAAPVVRACLETGGHAATFFDRVARLLDIHETQGIAGRNAGAGARLSARMIAGFPLAFIPFTPRDPAGLLVALVGIGLGIAGFKWISKLVPRPASSLDPATLLAFLIAATARAGVEPRALLLALTHEGRVPGDDALARAGTLMRFGLPWYVALARCRDPALEELAGAVEVSAMRGVPVADALETYAGARMTAARNRLDAGSRRAPVLMVLPLVLCVLPSFILLAMAPFLRSLFG